MFIIQYNLLIFQTISYMAERVVGHGSFGVVFQVNEMCLLFNLFNSSEDNCSLSSDIVYDCRLSAWKLVKLWLSKRFFKTRGTRTGSCKQCAFLTTQMLSLWSTVSFQPLKRMNYTLIWYSSMFLKQLIVWSNITTSWTKGCLWYMWNSILTRYACCPSRIQLCSMFRF